MTGLTDVLRLLVSVTVCAALLVATVCAAKVSVVGAKVSGSALVPLASSICWLTVALSLMTTAPLIVPLDPSAGEKVTLSVQVAAAASTRLAAQGFVPVPVAEKSPLVAIVVRVNELALLFLTVSDFAALVVPTA
jgi:integral membrane sensor domain MASE1